YATSVRVRETYRAPFVTGIELVEPNGTIHVMSVPADTTAAPGYYTFTFPATSYLVDEVIIRTTKADYEEIDAVELNGTPQPHVMTALGRVLSALDPLSGALGDITVADIRGLAFDSASGDLYAVHRREDGTTGNTLLDCLFKIDPLTGLHINDAFGTGVDYITIATNTLSTPLYNIDDISFDPNNGTLFAIANDSTAGVDDLDRLVTINTATGAVTNVGRFTLGATTTYVTNVQGMAFDADAVLRVSTGSTGSASIINRVWTVNTTNGQCVAQVSPTSTFSAYTDFEAIACPVNGILLPPTPSNLVQTSLTGSIGDLVYADANANGIRDAGESGVAGVRITVRSGTTTKEAVTGGAGTYRVHGLNANAGTPWNVDVDLNTLPADWVMTTPPNLQRTLATNSTQIDDADFGVFTPAPPASAAEIRGTVWTDRDEDGVIEDDEAPLEGIAVNLYRDRNGNNVLDSGDLLVRCVDTDENGLYIMAKLAPGAYLVDVLENTLPAGMDFVSGGSAVRPVTVAALQISTGHNYGFNHTASIGDLVYYDTNNNRAKDVTESGVPGVRVSVYLDENNNNEVDAAENEVGIAFTNASGVYSIGNLPAGEYVVRVDEQHVPAPPSSPNAGLYNTMLPTNGEEIAVTLAAAQVITTADFGFAELAEVEGYVFNDANYSTVRDTTEAGVANINISLVGATTGGTPVNLTTVTNAAGQYEFLVAAGSYSISFNTSDPDFPAGMTQNTTSITHDVAIHGGWELGNLNFGRAYAGALGGTVFADSNGNGGRDGGEGAVVGAVVELFNSAGTTFLDSRTVGADGSYRFNGLQNGTYVIKVNTASLTAMSGATVTADPVAPLDGIASSTVTNGSQNLNLNFGYLASNTPPPVSALCPPPRNQTLGAQYMVTRIGRDILGGQGYQQAQCIMSMSPNGRWITGVRFGTSTRGFVMNTLTSAYADVAKITASHPYAMGNDVNDDGNVVGHEKWTSGANANVIAWYHNRAAGTVQRLLTPFDANVSLSATPSAITSDSLFAFGTVDPDGPAGATAAQGGYWTLSTRAWTAISGLREVLDASADGTVLLVVNSSGQGQILRGSITGGWNTVVTTITGKLKGGKVSPDGRFVGTAETISGVPTPFVYDTLNATRQNLPRAVADTRGGIVGAISDTGRVLGTIYNANGSSAVLWESATAPYTSLANILRNDGHTAADINYAGWNLYNGG
ncbi:MAG: hypothetical protein JNG86_05455, partial [Verrucomicrobiaceae bacterium]|nr:hypothetical protein [Verrucomicrobiaceae bacterium]